MNNYQLYRTNVLLGGQMKYDLILNSTGDNNIIDDIHISPISDRIPYNKYVKEDILNYSHQENIKKFYKNISGSFYKDFINPLFDNSYPLPDDYKGDNYESTYEMGCRRKNYQLYGKQFEFFCPVWIEQISSLNQLKFEIQIKTVPDNISQTYKQPPLSITKIIKFSRDGEISKLEKYFNDYVKFIKLDNGRDWIFDINKTCSVVSGLNVETGINVEKELNGFYRDLIYRERPLLEFNNMIINELNKNNLITPQLFNFNICFNLEDLLSEFVMEQLYCQPIYININVLIDDKPLQYVDIFSNHEYIKKKVLSSYSYSQKITRENILERFIDCDDNLNEFNVLDYLKDNKCIDLIDKNKMMQNVCHWCTNKSFYHFNVYDGFGMLFNKNENEYTEIPYYSEHVADIKNSEIIDEIYQYPYWCNSYSLSKDHLKELIREIFNQYYDHDYLFSTFTSNCEVKNINYKTSKNIKPIDVMILEIAEWEDINRNFLKNVYGGKGWVYLEIENKENKENNIDYKILYNEILRKIILFSRPNRDYIKKLMYKNILSILSDASTPPLLLELSDILSNPNQNPFNDLIKFTNGLVYNKADSPSISSQEIEYYKAKSNKSLVRMMGKIKPYFIYSRDAYKNYQYYKLKYNETSPEYKIYAQSIYEPKYPSLNYTSLNYKDIKYEYKYDDNDLENSLIEYHHYMTNKIIYLLPYIDYEVEMVENSNLYVENLIKECIEKKYNILFESSIEDHKNKKDEKLSYIVNKYELTKSYIETDGDKPIYKIQIRLK